MPPGGPVWAGGGTPQKLRLMMAFELPHSADTGIDVRMSRLTTYLEWIFRVGKIITPLTCGYRGL